MNIQAEKLQVLQEIINSDDLSLIKDIKSLLRNRNMDWFNDLSEAQQSGYCRRNKSTKSRQLF